ncbi:MAG: DUF2391 family protein [Thermomicrobiales bacterium]
MAGGRATTRDDWEHEANALMRGIFGAYLVGIPLVYTMETWQIGHSITMPHALLFLAVSYVINLAFVVYAGFRGDEEDAPTRRPFGDALETTAIAAVTATLTLAVLAQLGTGLLAQVLVGKVAVLCLPLGIGASIANQLLHDAASSGGGREAAGGNGDGDAAHPRSAGRALASDAGAAFAGALLLSLSIAPTEEVTLLATELPTLMLPVVLGASLLLTYGIVFTAEFPGQAARLRAAGPLQRPLTETVLAYVIALLTGAALLWLFGRIDLDTSWHVAYSRIIVLGLPAAIGAAAGRLAL